MYKGELHESSYFSGCIVDEWIIWIQEGVENELRYL
jgi:hypothetical protein